MVINLTCLSFEATTEQTIILYNNIIIYNNIYNNIIIVCSVEATHNYTIWGTITQYIFEDAITQFELL